MKQLVHDDQHNPFGRRPGDRPGSGSRSIRRLVAISATLTCLVLATSCADGDSGETTTAAESPSAHGSHAQFEAPPAAPLRDGERFANLSMPAPYSPQAPAGATDEYRCFLVDPQLTAPAFLKGSQFLPDNTDLVHHAIFFRVAPEQVAEARKVDQAEAGEGWRCFGNAGIGDAAWVAHWAPGANETLLDPSVGYPMPPGSQLVMQVHYNLLTSKGKSDDADKSSIRLRLADGSADVKPLVTGLAPAPVELPCASGESGALCDRAAAVRDLTQRFGPESLETIEGLSKSCRPDGKPVAGATQSCTQPIEQAATVYAVAGHMHLLGRSISLELNPGTSRAQTLLDIPAYDFDQQEIHPLAKPVAVKAGDKLRVTCTHDASLRKQLPALRDVPARYVVWGEGTSDEMCLGLVVLTPTGSDT